MGGAGEGEERETGKGDGRIHWANIASRSQIQIYPAAPSPGPHPQLALPDPSSCLIQNETPLASLKGW